MKRFDFLKIIGLGAGMAQKIVRRFLKVGNSIIYMKEKMLKSGKEHKNKRMGMGRQKVFQIFMKIVQ